MRIDLLEAFGMDPNVIAILKEKYGAELLPIQERASPSVFVDYQRRIWTRWRPFGVPPHYAQIKINHCLEAR
jgi:hypothetical protein